MIGQIYFQYITRRILKNKKLTVMPILSNLRSDILQYSGLAALPEILLSIEEYQISNWTIYPQYRPYIALQDQIIEDVCRSKAAHK